MSLYASDHMSNKKIIRAHKKYSISLLHATRGRPEQAVAARDKWLNTADNPNAVEHIFGLDDDDTTCLELINTDRVVVPHGKGCVAAWNACASKCSGDILIQLSDDWEPVQGWDTLIIKEFEDTTEERVLAVSDGHRNDDLLCMAILNRARYVKQGFLFSPEFVSVFSDDYFTWAAKKDNVLKDAKHIVFEHKHPVFGKGAWDKTYTDSNTPARYSHGHITFNQLTRPDGAKICLAMIVKNEINNMRKCLASVKDYIDYWVICDTGSTDGTQELIQQIMDEYKIPGTLVNRPWVDFAHNRTESLQLAALNGDYTLVIDADDTLEVVSNPECFNNLKQDVYQFKIIHGDITYYRPQLIRSSIDWKYVGVLHEFLEGPPGVRMAPHIMMENVVMWAAASPERGGFSGSKKYIHDALVLEKALLDDNLPETLRTRYAFYLAQSYRDAGAFDKALEAYQRRVDLGGWPEEVYYAKYMIAAQKAHLKRNDEEVIDAFMQAWEYRPSRLDAIYDLIRFLGAKGRFTFAYALATIAMRIPPCKDILFVRHDISNWRLLDDYAILAARTGNTKEAIAAYTALMKTVHFSKLPEVEADRIKTNFENFQKQHVSA